MKKPCIEEAPILEDDLSEISDDADEILNREDVSMITIKLKCNSQIMLRIGRGKYERNNRTVGTNRKIDVDQFSRFD